jgi:serine protease Do
MKQLTGFILSGVVGGLIAIGGFSLMYEPPQMETQQEVPAQIRPASYFDAPLNTARVPFSFAEAAEKATPAVVHIRARESEERAKERMRQQQQQHPFYRFFRQDDWFPGELFGIEPFRGQRSPEFFQRRGSGSGVIVSSDGYVVTNNHVVQIADEITVTLNDNRTFSAELIGRDETTDLAVLKIEASNLPTLEFSDSDKSRVGDWVLAVGNPFDYLTSTVTAGIVSAKGRNLNIIDSEGSIESFIQTDAAVNPGNSGGALVDDQGRLLGINTAIATPTGVYAGYSFAIPINLASKIIDDIIEHGYYRRVFLGISITEMNSSLAKEIGVDVTSGVLIMEVQEESSAFRAGLEENDIIVSIDGRDIRNASEIQALVGASRVGDLLNVTVLRNGKVKNISVTLRE